MDDHLTPAQIQAGQLKAARHSRWVDRWWIPVMGLISLALVGVLALVLNNSTPTGPCYDATQLAPVWQGTTAVGHPAAEFQVPANSWAVVQMDGFFQVLGAGRSYGLNQGVLICNSPEEAGARAAKLNAGQAP